MLEEIKSEMKVVVRFVNSEDKTPFLSCQRCRGQPCMQTAGVITVGVRVRILGSIKLLTLLGIESNSGAGNLCQFLSL